MIETPSSESQQQEIVRDLLDLMPLVQPIGRRMPLLDRAYNRVVLLDECELRDEFLERIGRGFADYGYGMSAYNALCHVSDSTAKAHALCRLAQHPAVQSDTLCLKHTLDAALHWADLVNDQEERLWALIAVIEASAADPSDPNRGRIALALATGCRQA